ncbi:rhodanese-like protein [Dictyocaulus viviparus]|uniref:M-phase inducer phosphatase n=1 Tax=Dictyocaulus viviparus TaxID=29172 RepID=A0A0D8XYB9_DICVI|nr:rhodanese-like protein [Dictyocaulus viviparus]
MSLGLDKTHTRLADENLGVTNHRSAEPGSFTGNQAEDGDSRDSGIVPDYLCPLKADTPLKVTVRDVLTDKTNINSYPEDNIQSNVPKTSIEESPITSRRRVHRVPSYSVLHCDDDKGSILSLPNLETSGSISMRAASSTSVSSFSYSESDIIWTPPKVKVACSRSTSEERTGPTTNFRKRYTENVVTEAGVAKKRSCAIRGDFIQASSEINLVQDGIFESNDKSPNTNAREFGLSGFSVGSRCFTRTQSTGQLEKGEVQQKSPNFNHEVEYSLPAVEHPQSESLAFRSISAATLASEIRRLGPEDFDRRYVLIDCRYPYEYEGGHIKCAVNIHDQNDLEKIFFPEDPDHPIHSRIPIFYCEYSQKRGPGMALALRSIDRMHNELNYPKVDYAEMYLLDHGYRKFWSDGCYKSECVPCGYVPMTDAAHVSSLIKYKWHKSKSTSQLVVREKERQPLRKATFYRYRSLMQVCTEVETKTDVAISPTAKTPDLSPRRLEYLDSPDSSKVG